MASLIETLSSLPEELQAPLLKAFALHREELAQMVTKEDFSELKAVVAGLASEVRALAAAQQRTEERVDSLAQQVAELAKAQARTEKRVDSLAQQVAELAKAQARTEERVEELAQAQARTEEAVRELALGLKKTRQEVGGLADTVGYGLENLAYRGLAKLLKRDYGLSVEGRLLRRFIELEPERYEEVNIYGEAKRNGQKVWIVGEAKTNLSKQEVDRFLKKVARLENVLVGEKQLVGVVHTVHPKVEAYAKAKGIVLYWSYEFQ